MAFPRKTLTDEEKQKLRSKWNVCYICDTSLNGYENSEIQYDHIYDYESGYPQELSNFAPVHASRDPAKKNCHSRKGRKSPYEYKEELRIIEKLDNIKGLKDLCLKAKESIFTLDSENRNIILNGEQFKLFSQKLNGRDNWYFFAELPIDYIESDEEIQLRPLDSRIIGLTFSLRKSLQLLPSLARLDVNSKKIKVFDGQHKAVAQIVGNNRKSIPCLVFFNPDLKSLRETVTEAHSKFVQQRYSPSHIDKKLADIYDARIREFQQGDINRAWSELDILKRDTKSQRRQVLKGSIIDGLRDQGDFIKQYVYELRGPGRIKPIPYKNLEVFVDKFAYLEAIDKISGDPENYRASELKNLYFVLTCLEKYSLREKWDPDNPSSVTAQLPNLCYLTHPFKIWIEIYEKAIRGSKENMLNKAILGTVCYSRTFTPEIQNRIDKITERLFIHGLWLNPANIGTLRSIYDDEIRNLFFRDGLDHVYLMSLH